MQSKKQKEYYQLQKICKKIKKENKNIIDIVLFGSNAKGKLNPTDIDIAIITRKKDNEISSIIEKEIKNTHITTYTPEELLTTDEPIILSILHEGKSVITEKNISERLFLKPLVLYTYSGKQINKKDEVRYYYALKGRDGKSGIIKETNTIILAKATFLVPIEYDDTFKEFLTYWKINYKRKRIFIES